MTATILVGAQWGDEGKGRVADWLASQSDVVARYAGGDNAGHTVSVNERVYKLHLIPSGILHDHVICVLGNGMVINPVNLVTEMDELASLGVDISPDRLKISSRAHVITPAHITLDRLSELERGREAIGTTLRGIGPTYLDKVGRQGVQTSEMLNLDAFTATINQAVRHSNNESMKHDLTVMDTAEQVDHYVKAAERLQPYLQDTSGYLNRQLEAGASVLCEGAQGTMLDLDHGDYPFVTSSSPTAGGALTGLGFGPRYVERVVGVAKCFSTRVGSGPMPTELEGTIADQLRGTGENFWDEYGTTTGRPRRCGWLDAVLLRYAVQINGFTDMVLTKLDVLSGFDELKIATAYRVADGMTTTPPLTQATTEQAEPVYETIPGWHEQIDHVTDWDDLPATTQVYIERIESLCGVPISAVSVGPERDQLVHRYP